ncbi:GGDEF domain-containing protein [bacterium]|nr:MAG: GGDEF domain-containing protein [bacterium]
MKGIEDMEKMRARVDKLRENDLPGEDSVHDLAFAEGKSREKIRDILGEKVKDSDRTVGGPLVSQLADAQSTQALETMEAREESLLDPLTGLRNRRAYDEDVPMNVAMVYKKGKEGAQRSEESEKKECSMLFIDLDLLKLLNDTCGHDAGDEILRGVAGILKNTLKRESDVAYRFGGEEFIVFLPKTNLHGAKIVADAIRKTVANHIFPYKNKKGEVFELKTTVSIGCSSTESPDINGEMESKEIVEKLQKESDDAMYKAKEGGRNRIVAHGEEPNKAENS